MAVTQYIGSRYVPVFAEPEEWSDQNTYEPLTIVMHEGNSFTSKQAVPKGIAITNSDFWAVTGNYNGQVEQYRRETAALAAAVDEAQQSADTAQQTAEEALEIKSIIPAESFSAESTVKDYIDTKNGLGNVRNYGAIENAENDWQSIIDQVAAASNVINFDGGNWVINQSLTIPPNIVYIYGGGCCVTSTEHVDTLFTLSRTDTKPHLMDGFYFELNGNVDTAIRLASGNWGTISNCTFHHVKAYGIYSYNHIGMHVSNCVFENDYGESDGVAILGMSDNMIDHVKIFRFKYGIAITGGLVTSSYLWLPCSGDIQRTYGIVTPSFFSYYEPELVINSALVNINPLTMGNGRIIVIGCEMDCVSVISACAETTITGCSFYWNFSDGDQDVYETDVVILELAFTQGANRNRNSGSLRMADTNYYYGATNYTNRIRNFSETKINIDTLGASTNQDFNITTKIERCGIDATNVEWGSIVNAFADNTANLTIDFNKTLRPIPNTYDSTYTDSYVVFKTDPVSESRLMNYTSGSSLGINFHVLNADSVARYNDFFWKLDWFHFDVDVVNHEITYVLIPAITFFAGYSYSAYTDFKAYLHWEQQVINGKYFYTFYLMINPSRNVCFELLESLKHPIHVCKELLRNLPAENIVDVSDRMKTYIDSRVGGKIFTEHVNP